jgi:DNA-directed RNA polymerase subunit RPC12/RpoP
MSSHFTNDPDIKPEDKVECDICGSKVLLKNMSAHTKTVKHQKAIVDKKPSVKPILNKTLPPGTIAPEPETNSDDEEDEFELILDSIQAFHVRLDEIQDTIEAGLTLLIGNDDWLNDEFDENEPVTESEKVVNVSANANVKPAPKKPKAPIKPKLQRTDSAVPEVLGSEKTLGLVLPTTLANSGPTPSQPNPSPPPTHVTF